MSESFRFVPDPHGIDEISKGKAVAVLLTDAAERGAARVRNLAKNLKRSDFLSFRDAIAVMPAKKVGDTYEAAVTADSPGWHLQEYGTSRIRAKAIIRKGMRQAPGIDFEEGPSTR